MDTFFAVLLLVTAVVTVAYWIDFFLHGTVNVVDEEWYLRFQRAFPVADAWMSACAVIGAVGLLTGSGVGVAFSLAAAGALVFLGLMDVTFNIDNGLYRHLATSAPMRAELVINVWTIGLGATLVAYLAGRVS
ncbi:MAG TPA: hypothetical protein VFR23_12710 [Jiangellaceae bacterium]|nr:hypothetical protein [Jiangellaceae bacterium]